ncbi:MAG TPA: aromatic ring-hydroxylating dioxygenase subunit alpha [Reyranella sp.]|nr:aromatic ring-hydroxylating dioxygenase subunit alpha [Reyranella sp.]
MWIRNAWYVAAWTHEIEPGRIHARTIIDQSLALYRTASGEVVALEDRCCHRFAPLTLGRLEGDDLRCMYHGLKFAPDGRCIEIPGQKLIPQSACVRRYPVEIVGSWIWVWMGDADAADRSTIPTTLALDDPSYRLKAGQLDYAAHYLLIDDNLLDLSHLSFAHEKTIGMDMPQWADQRPRTTTLDRGLRFERWHTDHPPRGFMKAQLGEKVDLWNAYDFLFPGIFLQRTGFYPPGTAARSGNGKPEVEPLFYRIDEQAVTPVGERSSRYFYAAGTRAQDLNDDQLERLYAVTARAFLEDKTIIEAQQKLIDKEPDRQMLPTSLDAGPTQFRKMVEKLAS